MKILMLSTKPILKIIIIIIIVMIMIMVVIIIINNERCKLSLI